MERARRDKQDVIRVHEAVLGVHGAAFHDGEQIALDPFAGNVGGTLLRTAGELVDFINEHDAHLLHALTGEIGDLVLVHELGGLVLDEMTPRRTDLHLLAVRLLREQLAERALHLIAELFHAGHAQHTDGLRLFLHLELDLAVIKESLPEKLAQLLTGVLPAVAGGQKQIEQALLSGGFGTAFDLFGLFSAHKIDADFHKVADHGFHVAAHIADFGVLGGLNLDERSRAQLGEATGNFSLAYPCGAHHNDIAGSDLVAQFRRKALAAPTVPNRYGNHTLRLILTDDVFVQFRDDFAGRQFTHVRSSLKKCRPKHLEGPPVPQNSYNRATALQTF